MQSSIISRRLPWGLGEEWVGVGVGGTGPAMQVGKGVERQEQQIWEVHSGQWGRNEPVVGVELQ